MGPAFYSYAGPLYERCCSIVQQQLLQYQAYQQNPDMEEPDKDFLVVTIDLLSGLIQGLGIQMKTLLDSSNPPLFSLIGICLKVSYTIYDLFGTEVITFVSIPNPAFDSHHTPW